MYRNYLAAKTIFEDFVVFCCCIFMLKIVCVCYLTWHDYPSLVEGESHGILYIIIIFETKYAEFHFINIQK